VGSESTDRFILPSLTSSSHQPIDLFFGNDVFQARMLSLGESLPWYKKLHPVCSASEITENDPYLEI
jgi:hypothetical protein